MAGSGRKIFSPGEVLTASNVMNYLQDQTVMAFAGTAARGSAIGTAVSEGMMSYLKDTDSIEFYNGTIWKKPIGSIVQIVTNVSTITVSNTTGSFVDAGLSATITPKYSNSKILIFISQQYSISTGGADSWGSWRILRDSTAIAAPATAFEYGRVGSTVRGRYGFSFVDEPSSTSAVVYKTQTQAYTPTSASITTQDSNNYSTIMLIEVTA